MGMNIYTKLKEPIKYKDSFDGKMKEDWEGKHIGKRFAAGVWCWDCKVPMFDEDRKTRVAGIDLPVQLDNCPSCGKPRSEEGKYNPAMRELGFDKDAPYKPKGIDGASGFVWCIDETTGLGKTKDEVLEKISDFEMLVDEYGRDLTREQFYRMFDQIIIEKFSDGDFS